MTAPEATTTIGAKARRGFAWSTVGSLVLRVGNFGVGIIMARLLAPEQFGVFAVALTVQTIVLAFVEMGLTADLVRLGNIRARAATATTVAVGLALIFATAMALLAGPMSEALGAGQAAPVVRVMSITLVLSALATVPHAILQTGFRQSAQFAVDGSGLLVNTVAVLSLALLGFGAMSLALASVLSLATTCVLQYVITHTRPRFGFDREVATQLIRFGLPLALANLLSWVVMNVDYVVVGWHSGPIILGTYVLAFNMASWPMSSLGLALRVVALPGFSQLDDKRRSAGLSLAAGLSFTLALLAGVLLSSLASVVIPFVYGDKWQAAAQALAGLAFFGALRVVFDLMATYLIAAGATRAVLVVQVLWLLALGPAMVIGLDRWGLAGAGWAHVVIGVGIALPAYLLAVRSRGARPLAILKNMAVPLIAVAPAMFAGYQISELFDMRLLALLSGGLAASAVYLGIVFLWARRLLRRMRAVMDVEHDEEKQLGEPKLAAIA
ncbi:lipopolysaccharide biosynthesis protein [Rhizocola hellebori]|uniref:Lipopolysaccharide biosynthesis protein n=1 Tax=Rhizocola hellebori TaxID=1392758 RepID=A0A8J3QHK4_9ACTN|nr:lipopolysaccharide biosynthesis protein [Rhizocola hellebori]